jgi:hypothetical protein
MNHSYHAKKTGGTELISIVGSLHIDPFILHTKPFQLVVQGGIVYRKNLKAFTRLLHTHLSLLYIYLYPLGNRVPVGY